MMLVLWSFTYVRALHATRFVTAWVRLMGGFVINMMLSNLSKHLEKKHKAAQAQAAQKS